MIFFQLSSSYLNLLIFLIAPTTSNGQTYNVITFAGNPPNGLKNGVGTSASFKWPYGIGLDSNDIMYLADLGNNQIRRITPDASVSLFVGHPNGTAGNGNLQGTNSLFDSPYGVTVCNNTIFVTEFGGNRVRKITMDGQNFAVAGSPTALSGSNDAVGSLATFDNPTGAVCDTFGNLFVADHMNNLIRKIDAIGNVTTFSGKTSPGTADGQGTLGQFRAPRAITIDKYNNLYVTDRENHKIRKITPSGFVSTVAGSFSARAIGKTDGQGTNARFSGPVGITIDREGNLFVADRYNHNIRKINTTGYVSTVAGSLDGLEGNDNGEGIYSKFDSPRDLAIDSKGNLYVSEPEKHRIRKIVICPENTWNPLFQECNPICPAGQMINDTLKMCQSCPLGTFKNTAGNNGSCINCPLNTTPNSNRSECISCQAGRQRPSNDLNICICSDGLRLNTTSDTCEVCPIGQEVSTSGLSCLQCPQNKTRPSTSLPSCIDCPQNSICNATHVQCLPGYQVSSNQTACLQCPDGFINPAGGLSQCTKCPLGKQPDGNRTECVICPYGTFKPLESLSSCIDCPVGSNCTPTNLTCLAGYEKSQNSYECSQCSNGFFKSNENDDSCVKCPTGTYSSDDYSQCFSCPSGNAPGDNGNCTRCGAGREPLFNRTMCIDCPHGKYKPTDLYDTCLKCPFGATCSTLELACNAGYYFIGSGCRRCPFGTFKANAGNSLTCGKCGPGTQSSQDRTGCDPCPSGQYRSPNSLYPFCIDCPIYSDKCSPTTFTCKAGYWMNSAKDGCETNIIGPIVETTTVELSINQNKEQPNTGDFGIAAMGMNIIYGTIAFVGCILMIGGGVIGRRAYRKYNAMPYDRTVTNNFTVTSSVELIACTDLDPTTTTTVNI